jgi:DNA mismatch endonuclease (patch repair protein)
MRPRRVKGRKLTKSEQMARVRSRDTAPETLLRRTLWAAGLRYRVRPRLPGTPDLAFPRARVAVFVDGCFWHGCPRHYTAPAANAGFWGAKLSRNLSRDRKVDRALSESGWTVVRIWEHEVTEDADAAVGRLGALVAAAKASLDGVPRAAAPKSALVRPI